MPKMEFRPEIGGNMNVKLWTDKDVWIELNVRLLSKDGKKIQMNLFAMNNDVYNNLTMGGTDFYPQC